MQKSLSQEKIDSFRDVMNCLQNEKHWKDQTRYVLVRSQKEALRIAEALTFFLGGAEIESEIKIEETLTGKNIVEFFKVGSKGYYHYMA